MIFPPVCPPFLRVTMALTDKPAEQIRLDKRSAGGALNGTGKPPCRGGDGHRGPKTKIDSSFLACQARAWAGGKSRLLTGLTAFSLPG